MGLLSRCAGLCITVGLFLAPAAAAKAPDRGTFDFTTSFTDTEVCAAFGFDVFVPVQHEYGFFKAFTDRSGDVVRVRSDRSRASSSWATSAIAACRPTPCAGSAARRRARSSGDASR